MGKKRVIAETGAGQHGVASATVAARYGMECVVYMGAEDVMRQAPNVFRMKLLGATVVPVSSGSKTLKDALNEAMRDWVTNVETTFYILGTVAGPHPYPMLVRDFQCVIGRECLTQMPELTGRQPDAVIACVGGGSNAIGIFHPYIPYERRAPDRRRSRRLRHRQRQACRAAVGRQPGRAARLPQLSDAGRKRPDHRNPLDLRRPRLPRRRAGACVAQGCRSCRIRRHQRRRSAWLHSTICVVSKGIIPALESSHAVAQAKKLAPTLKKDQIILVNLSGRGDKDINTVAKVSGITL